MLRGDLSNDTVPRWVITLDVLTSDHLLPKKRALRSWTKLAQDTSLDRLVSGQMYQASDRHPIIFELATFGQHRDYVAALFRRLEDENWLTRYVVSYDSRRDLASALPYRPDVKAVIDTPEHILLWGSRGITLKELLI